MSDRPVRRMFSRGEWLILLGLCLCVVSAALKWGKNSPPSISADPAVIAFRREISVEVAGYDKQLGWLKAGWGAVLLSVACGSLLLAEPTRQSAKPLLAVHLMFVLGIFAIVILSAGFYPGVLLCGVGSLLLLAGGVLRYR